MVQPRSNTINQFTNHMKSIQDIIAELQAVDQTSLENSVAALNAAIADLQAFVTPSTDPITSVTVTFQSGAMENFTPVTTS